MRTQSSRTVGVLLVGGFLLLTSARANATAIAYSDLTVLGISVVPAAGSLELVAGSYGIAAFAMAQNSLGELDAQSDGTPSDPALAAAAVTWATGQGVSSPPGLYGASSANIPGTAIGAANSVGQGLFFVSFVVTCDLPPCGPDTLVDFSADVSGSATVMTDAYGELAWTEAIFNLNLDGDPLLFYDVLKSIGSNDSQATLFSTTLTGSRTLMYDTPYGLVVRADSESMVINTPEPATATLLCLGLGAAMCAGRSRFRSRTRV